MKTNNTGLRPVVYTAPMRTLFLSLLAITASFSLRAQQQPAKEKEDLGDKEYIIVKDYKPVLAESYKISDTPEGDTSTVNTPMMKYSIVSKKVETNYETSTIKAVNVKDEPLPKLYRNLVKLGIGNYTTYNGEAYINSLRSKKGALGFEAKHLSGSPNLKDAGYAGFGNTMASVFGKYFLENATFDGEVGYKRDVVHYYGFNTNDTIIDKKLIKQRLGNFALNLGFGSNYLSKGHLDYEARFGYSTLNDLYEVTENEFLVEGFAGKQLENFYLKLAASFDYFKKSDAKYEKLNLNSNLNRNIISFTPTLDFSKEKYHLVLGGRLTIEKNLGSVAHLYPVVEFSLPVAEHILSVFANVEGHLEKSNFRTLTDENPFVSSAVKPGNVNNKLNLQAGVLGNFSSTVSFTASVKYGKQEGMELFVPDTEYFNKFDVLEDDGSVLNFHAELGYDSGDKLNLSLHFDQFTYNLDQQVKAWHRPGTEVTFRAGYNLRDKILVKADILARGKTYGAVRENYGWKAEKINSWVDGNLGIEYRYSKILSIYVNLNNLGFSKYYQWYKYPSERFNILGGLSYSF